MKRKVILGVCLAMMVMLFVGCGEKVVCDFCGEEKSGQTKEVLGEEVDICDDCMGELQNMAN